MGAVISVNVGRPAQIGTRQGRPVYSGIGKQPAAGRIAVRGVNLDGDDQADRRVHGGPDKAVYAYASEDTAWWEAQLERPLGPAAFGENLTLAGVEVTEAVIGEIWRVGSAELQVCQPRLPCYKLGLKFGDPQMLKWFAQAARPGAYLRILEEGEIGAGDEIQIGERPAHGVTIATVNEAMLWENHATAAALAAPELPVALAEWLRERAAAA
jgi:MOSC domain-containing protein YiiM